MVALTDKQTAFVEGVRRHGKIALAAREAGYANPEVQGSLELRKPHIQEAILDRARQDLMSGAVRAVGVLIDLLDPRRNERVRLEAAKYLVRAAGLEVQPDALRSDDLKRMTRDDIVKLIGALQAGHDAIPVAQIDHDPDAVGVFD